MSGPKVIRIVTREELVARSEALLSRLDAVIAEWKACCDKANMSKPAEVAEVQARKEQIRSLIAANRFDQLSTQVAQEISYLRSDGERRLEEAAKAAAKARERRRRSSSAAKSLLAELRRSKGVVPSDILQGLEAGTRGDLVEDEILAKAFQLLAQASSAEKSDKQRELAAALGSGQAGMSLRQWLNRHAAPMEHQLGQAIDRDIGQLETFGATEAATQFAARADEISNETQLSRRAMLADSLRVEISATLTKARDYRNLLAEVSEEIAELKTLNSAASRELEPLLAAATSRRSVDEIRHFASLVRAAVSGERKTQAAAAKRRAVLQGLAQLGYEVTEGMATAWVQNGRLVLRKSATPALGMEIGGGPQADRLQIRAVALEGPLQGRDAHQDRDVEATWCSDVDRLRTLMAGAGNAIHIDASTPIGVAPLKVAQLDQTLHADPIELPADQNLQRRV